MVKTRHEVITSASRYHTSRSNYYFQRLQQASASRILLRSVFAEVISPGAERGMIAFCWGEVNTEPPGVPVTYMLFWLEGSHLLSRLEGSHLPFLPHAVLTGISNPYSLWITTKVLGYSSCASTRTTY